MQLLKKFFGKYLMWRSEPLPPRRVGIVGTFDVENYGDLLFPLVAKAALTRRGGNSEVVAFSPNRRSVTTWPYEVYSTLDLPDQLGSLAALLIGGGQIIRFDSGYPVPTDPSVRLPVDYWLTPATLAVLAGKPVFWNASGVWTGTPAAPWYDEVVRACLMGSPFVGLRDEASRAYLASIAPAAELRFLPDTVFSIGRLWPLARETDAFIAWRKTVGVSGPYVVVQADQRFDASRPAIDALVAGLGVRTAVLLPVCRCHGDSADGLAPLPCGFTARSTWPEPRLLSEIIGRSAIVIASSLHACITAIAYGVPAIRVPSANAADRKFEILNGFAGVASLGHAEAVAAVVRRGRRVEPRADEYADRLDAYWDRLGDVLREPRQHDMSHASADLSRWVASVFPMLEMTGRTDGSQNA